MDFPSQETDFERQVHMDFSWPETDFEKKIHSGLL